MTIGIKSEKEFFDEFARAYETARRGLPVKPSVGTYFTSLEAVRNFLTPKRLSLVHLIKEKSPASIYALAKLAERSFPSVLKDVNLLVRHGIVTLSRDKTSARRSLHPRVGYEAINLWIGL